MPPDEVTEGPVPPAPGEPAPGEPAPGEPAPGPDATTTVSQPYVPPPPPISRATRGGKRLRSMLFVIGLAGLALGAIAIRSAALLGDRIDPDLVTTPELASMSTIALVAQGVVLVLAPIALLAGRRWSSRVRAALHGLGDGEPLLAPARTTARITLALGVVGVALVAIGRPGPARADRSRRRARVLGPHGGGRAGAARRRRAARLAHR